MALDKSKLQQRMTASTATPISIQPTNLTEAPVAKPNGANAAGANLNVPKLRGIKDGVVRTQRYSFEITTDLKDQLEQAIKDYRMATGNDISKSQVIRNALAKHLKGGKL